MPTPPKLIVVLGARVVDHQISPTLASRLDTVIALHTGQPVVVCGGNPVHGVTEADLMADYLGRAGIEPIIKENESTTTLENIDNLIALLNAPPLSNLGLESSSQKSDIVVVTSYTHVPRTRAILATKGLTAKVIGAPQPWRKIPQAIARELGASLLWAFRR